MPRDASGNYTLPAGNPVVTGTTVDSSWANDTMDDIKTVLTDSLSRTGDGGMLVAFEFASGLVSAPGMSWTSEPTSGFYLAATNDMRVSIAGSDRARFRADATNPFQIWAGGAWADVLSEGGNYTFTGTIVFNGTTTVPEATVTAHEAALTITESQISDLGTYTLVADLASTVNAKGASLVGIEDAGSIITGVTVEAALAEIAAAVVTNTADIATNTSDITALAVESSGSFTPVHSGFSSPPTGDIRWKRVGNIVTLQCDFSTGTSDSTFWGITNWPAALQCTEEVKAPIFGYVNNTANASLLGAFVLGWSLPGSPEVAGLYSSMAGGAWTASGTKGLLPTSYGPAQIMYTIY